MSQAILVDAIREAQPDLTLAQAGVALESVLEKIIDSVQEGTPIVLARFGSFSPKVTSARTCRNPATGEPVEVPAKATIRFKPSKAVVVS